MGLFFFKDDFMELKQCNESCEKFSTCTNKLSDMVIDTGEFVDTMYNLLHEGYAEEAIKSFVTIELADEHSLISNKEDARIHKLLRELDDGIEAFETSKPFVYSIIYDINNCTSKEFWRAGQMLKFIKDTKCYKDINYKSFKDFINSEIKYSLSHVYKLINAFKCYKNIVEGLVCQNVKEL